MAMRSPAPAAPMRYRGRVGRLLDGLYLASGAAAAMFLVAICVIVSLQVAANAADLVATWLIGRPLGLMVPSYAELAGFFLAAASFLALPHALRGGAHIRVTSVLDRLGERARGAAEIWCAALGAALSGYFTWYSALLVAESVRYGDVSPGMIPVPLWIPQIPISVGLAVLTIAFIDRFVSMMAGVWPGEEPDTAAPPAGR